MKTRWCCCQCGWGFGGKAGQTRVPEGSPARHSTGEGRGATRRAEGYPYFARRLAERPVHMVFLLGNVAREVLPRH